MNWYGRFNLNTCQVVGFGLVAIQALALYAMGQPPICTCGYIKLWEGIVSGSGNSQHLSDWYSFSHIIHGFLFYLLLWLVAPRMSVWTRLLFAMGIEISWELIENSPMIISRYRETALAQGYSGDSIINSLSDTTMMVVGFILAARVRVWLIVLTALVMEIVVGYLIHDNLTLNIIALIHPVPVISAWQTAGGLF